MSVFVEHVGLSGRVRRPEEKTRTRAHNKLGEGCCYQEHYTTTGNDPDQINPT